MNRRGYVLVYVCLVDGHVRGVGDGGWGVGDGALIHTSALTSNREIRDAAIRSYPWRIRRIGARKFWCRCCCSVPCACFSPHQRLPLLSSSIELT